MIYPTILLDLDGVVVDFFNKLIEVYNKRYNKSLTMQELDQQFDHLDPNLVSIFNEVGWFLRLAPLPNAINDVNEIKRAGYKVFICTAPARNLKGEINEESISEKFKWIRQWLPGWGNEIVPIKFKEMVCGDIMLDDAPYNLTTWCNKNKESLGIIIDQPWNQSWKDYPINCIRANLSDVITLVNKFWCFERGKIIYRLDELDEWKKK